MVKYFIIYCLGMTLVLCGCKKSVQQKFVGTWEMVSFDTGAPLYTTFTFYDGDMMIWTKTDLNDSIISDTAYYYIESRLLKNYLKLSKFEESGASPNGKWFIDKIDDKVLQITRVEKPDGTAPYYRFEFTKKQ